MVDAFVCSCWLAGADITDGNATKDIENLVERTGFLTNRSDGRGSGPDVFGEAVNRFYRRLHDALTLLSALRAAPAASSAFSATERMVPAISVIAVATLTVSCFCCIAPSPHRPVAPSPRRCASGRRRRPSRRY